MTAPVRSRRRGALIWVAVVAAAIAVALVLGPPGADGPRLDPSSTGPSGTKALVDTLRELGATVSVQTGGPDAALALPPTDGVTLILDDTLADGQRARVVEWTEAGGTLVLADPLSPLNPFEVGETVAVGPLQPELRRQCSLPALGGADRVVAPDGVLMPVRSGATGCYSRPDGSWLVVDRQGDGTLVVIGGAGAFTNSQLGKADNAVLAANLLAPSPETRVAVPWVQRAGSGEKSLPELIPAGVKLGMVQLGLAFVLVVLWRGRRLGRPVVEDHPVAIEGSETVSAVGRLLQRARARPQAAQILREDLRRALAVRLGLPPDAPPDQVADVAAARFGVARERVLGVLAGADPAGEDALVGLAQSVESLRREVEHVP